MNIRTGVHGDYKILARLIVQAMEDLAFAFVSNENLDIAYRAFEYLCGQEDNLYSYQNARVLVDEEGVAGAISGYDGAKLIELRKPVFDYFSSEYGFKGVMEEETEAGELYIDTLSVLPDRQGRGYGKLLIQDFIQYASENKYKRVGLLVDNNNPLAKNLYERLGFSKVGDKILLGGHYEHLQYRL